MNKRNTLPLIKKYRSYLLYDSDRQTSKKTAELYIKGIMGFLRWLNRGRRVKSDELLLSASGRDIESYFKYLYKNGISKNTRATWINNSIRNFYCYERFAHKNKLISEPLQYNVKFRKSEKECAIEKRYLESGDIEKIQDYVSNMILRFETLRQQYNKLQKIVLIEILIETGARISEIVNLQWDNILFDKRRIKFVSMKTRQQNNNGIREFPLSTKSNLLDLLRELKSNYIYIFTEHPIRIFDFTVRNAERFLANIDIVGFHLHPHLFRHYRTTKLVDAEDENGNKIFCLKEVAAVMGMSRKTVEDIYYHPTVENIQKKFERI